MKIGWRYLRQALVRGWELPTDLRLSSALDPEPAIASQIQAIKRKREFDFHSPGGEAIVSPLSSNHARESKTA